MKIKLLANVTLDAKAERKKLDGKTHLVVPCVAIKEGVLNNIFYSAEELKVFAHAWNGVPVPVNHPISGGVPVTANSVTCEDTVNIGKFYNVVFDGTALKGEIWINIAKAKKLGFEEIVTKLESGEMMEISTGLFANSIEQAGEYKGKPYTHVAERITPDHLALLPDTPGACSIKDGCGALRNNCADKPACDCGCTEPKANAFVLTNTGESFDEIRKALYSALKARGFPYAYIADIFEDYFVYEYDSRLLKRSYSIDTNGDAILDDTTSEVKSQVRYVSASAQPVINTTMKPERKKALVDALAVALVANAADVTDAKKASLNAMDDDMLNNMAEAKGIKLDDDGKPVVEAPAQTPAPAPATPVANAAAPALPADQAALLARLMANEASRLNGKRESLVKANIGFTAEMVANYDEATLDVMLTNAGVGTTAQPVAYGVGGATPAPKNNKQERPSREFFTYGRETAKA